MELSCIHTYEEAVQAIRSIGILPLAPLVPEHPSLTALTKEEQWHTDTENDPWRWRVRFPADGVAAYGKFFKKKGVFIATEILPWIVAIQGSYQSISERFEDGLISREASKLYEIIEAQQGIDTRSLRAAAGMKAKEQKKYFDNALVELQASMDIVISGVHERINKDGTTSGWNSTSFETMDHWVKNAGIDLQPIPINEAKAAIHQWLDEKCSPQAMTYFSKLFNLSKTHA